MPIEYALLKDAPEPLEECPKCHAAPFRAFMRGQVQSAWRKLWRRPYCCVICASCKEIVGYEKPNQGVNYMREGPGAVFEAKR